MQIFKDEFVQKQQNDQVPSRFISPTFGPHHESIYNYKDVLHIDINCVNSQNSVTKLLHEPLYNIGMSAPLALSHFRS